MNSVRVRFLRSAPGAECWLNSTSREKSSAHITTAPLLFHSVSGTSSNCSVSSEERSVTEGPAKPLFAGELRPPLPKEEVDKVVAMESLLASSTGGVLGRRSGRPRWEPCSTSASVVTCALVSHDECDWEGTPP